MNNIDIIIKNKNIKIGDYINIEIPIPDIDIDTSKIDIEHKYLKNQISESGLLMLDEPVFIDNKIIFKLVSYKAGEVKIEPITIKVDGVAVFETLPSKITVNGKEGELELVDIKQAKQIYTPIYYYFFYGLLFVILAFVIWILYKKFFKKRNILNTAEQVFISPYDKAIQTLNDIEQDLDLKKDIKKYVTKISETLRRFIEEEYTVNIMELTTTEMIRVLKNKKMFNIKNLDDLKKYFTLSDIIKFSDENLEAPVNFLEDTKKHIDTLKVPVNEV